MALQEDQVVGLEHHADAPRAVAMNATRKARDVAEAWDAVAAGAVGYVFLAPEQLAKDDVLERLRDAGVALVAVDEAHTASRPGATTSGPTTWRSARSWSAWAARRCSR